MSIIDSIEKLIIGHSSATIQKERLVFLREQFAALEKELGILKSENADMKKENKNLKSVNSDHEFQIQKLEKTIKDFHNARPLPKVIMKKDL